MVEHQDIDLFFSDRLTWLASQIFRAFPDEVQGLKLHALDCGCIFYRRIFPDGTLDSRLGIYRDGQEGPCEACIGLPKDWDERVVDEELVFRKEVLIT